MRQAHVALSSKSLSRDARGVGGGDSRAVVLRGAICMQYSSVHFVYDGLQLLCIQCDSPQEQVFWRYNYQLGLVKDELTL